MNTEGLKFSFLESFSFSFQDILLEKNLSFRQRLVQWGALPISWQQYIGPGPQRKAEPIYVTVVVGLHER